MKKQYTIDFLDKEGKERQTFVIGRDGLTCMKKALKNEGSTIVRIWRIGFRPALIYGNI